LQPYQGYVARTPISDNCYDPGRVSKCTQALC